MFTRVGAQFSTVGLSAALLSLSTALWAAPTIVITAPPAGQPVDPRPTIKVSYSSSPALLNLDSLRISVNGSDWTMRFARGPGSASYTVGGADTLVAGTLTIQASIADESGESISATADYTVLPTLLALSPTRGPIGAELQVSALGLDASPSNNALVFRVLLGGEALSPFSSALPGTSQGTARVPEGADSGAVFLSVEQCPLSQSFLTAQPFPCSAPITPIEVLSTTTRWKPQRGDEPIQVNFSGPDDLNLDSGTLEIVGPAGPSTVTGPIVRTSPTGPFTYRMEWNGPWTYTDPGDGQVKRLPAGDYSVVAKATPQGGSPASSAPYGKVSLVEVSQIASLQCGPSAGVDCPEGGARLALNDGPGGGTAAFPDAVVPGGDFQRGVVVRATLQPDLGEDASQVMVHFRWIDVDDPSAGRDAGGEPINHPVDNDTDTNADNQNENAMIEPPVAATGGHGADATSFFSVSTQQGNNYRLAASTDEGWLADIQGVVSSETGEVTHSSGEALREGVQVSQMLTVWRTLHLEIDRYGIEPSLEAVIQQSLDRTGEWSALQGDKLIDDKPGALFDTSHDQAGDWIGGDLSASFQADDGYRVIASTANEARVTVGAGQPDLLNGQTPVSILDRAYTIRDDELTRFLGVRADNNALLRELLARVYVNVEEHAGGVEDSFNPNPVIPWYPLVHLLDLIRSNSTFLPRDVANSASFWTVPVVLAFEAKGAPRAPGQTPLTPRNEERLDTHDPTPTTLRSGLLGYTAVPAGAGNQPTAVSFVETIRDFTETNKSQIRPTVPLTELQQSNVAHEVLHGLGLAHTGGIMCGTKKNYIKDPDRYALTDRQLAALRGIAQPEIGPDENAVCGTPGAPASPDCCPARPPAP